MERNEILLILLGLSHYYELYDRIYKILSDGSEFSEKYLKDMELENFKNVNELREYFERKKKH